MKLHISEQQKIYNLKLKKLKYKCSMKLTTDIIKLPSKYGKYKYPKLIELYNYTF